MFLKLRAEQVKRAAKNKDILLWGKLLFPDKFYLPFCYELHQYFIDIRHDLFTSTEAPRGHAKTLIKCFLIPTFQALEESKVHQDGIPRYRHYLNVQATEQKGLDVNRSIKIEFEENDLLKEVYGNQISKRWTDQQFVLKNGTIFTSVSAGQSIRGINYRNIRPDYIITDDLYNEDDINNPEATEKKNAWFWGTLYQARAKSRASSIHIQGTAINSYDLLAQLKKDKTVRQRTFRAITDDVGKIVLWKELNTYDSLMRDKELMSETIFMREMQNERRDEASALIKDSWLADWEVDPAEIITDDVNVTILSVRIGIDPSIGEKETSDFTGMARIFHVRMNLTGKEFFLIDGLLNEHLSLEDRIVATKDFSAAHLPLYPRCAVTNVRIEGISGFKDFAQTVANRTSLPVSIIDHVRDKISTLENKSHFFQNKKVKINKNIDKKLKDMVRYQLTTNYAKHDDLRDAVLLCLDEQGSIWNFVQ